LEQLNQLQSTLTSKDLSSVDPKQLINQVLRIFSKWRHWEIGNLSKSRLFTKLFEQYKNQNTASLDVVGDVQRFLTTSINYGHVRIDSITFSVLEGKRKNMISIGPIEVDFESNYRNDMPNIG